MKIIKIEPKSPKEEAIQITDDLARTYGLDKWAADFWMMTAGYRDRLDPADWANPEVPFNCLTVAIMAEAKARVFSRKAGSGQRGEIHIGGEVRPHTQDFIKVAARVYAHHGFHVRLRKDICTTPIWYSSFGVFYLKLQSGDNFTASHSQYFKGGWKPMGPEGKQLIEEEDEIVKEVRDIVAGRQTIILAPWTEGTTIRDDFDADAAYARYQEMVVGNDMLKNIIRAGQAGFCCAASGLGGSMPASTARIFRLLKIDVGDQGVIRYFKSEESSIYHGIGQVGDENFGVDPSNPRTLRQLGAADILRSSGARLLIVWDPDGDRMNFVAVVPQEDLETARRLELSIGEEMTPGCFLVFFTPNQLYLMQVAFRLEMLRRTGEFDSCDWFIASTFPTTKTLDELAAREHIATVRVPVGFKYLGGACEEIERQAGRDALIESADGKRISLGRNPRPLILCEESGGAAYGGSGLFSNHDGSRALLAIREKDGMQNALFTIGLAARLFFEDRSFVSYYSEVTSRYNIQYLSYLRNDFVLYDEGLIGEELRQAKAAGVIRRDKIMDFFSRLVDRHRAGTLSLQGMQAEINGLRSEGAAEMPVPLRAFMAGDGPLFECEGLRFLVGSSRVDLQACKLEYSIVSPK